MLEYTHTLVLSAKHKRDKINIGTMTSASFSATISQNTSLEHFLKVQLPKGSQSLTAHGKRVT